MNGKFPQSHFIVVIIIFCSYAVVIIFVHKSWFVFQIVILGKMSWSENTRWKYLQEHYKVLGTFC